MRRWSVAAAFVAALFMAGLATPLVQTVILQLRSMVPQIDEPVDQPLYEAVLRAIGSNRNILSVRRVFRALAEGKPAHAELAALRQTDPTNSLSDYLDLLDLLRQDQASKTSAGASDATLLKLLHRLQPEPPPRIYLSVQREIAEAAFRQGGLSLRRSAAEADRIRYLYIPLKESHRPVVRELADLLIEKGVSWRNAGRPENALVAHEVVARLLTGLVDDSPTVDVTFLAVERLPSALYELAEDVRTAGLDAHNVPTEQGEMTTISQACERSARKATAWHQRYHEVVRAEGNNLLPYTGDSVLTSPVHNRVLRSLCAAVLSAGTWLVLATLSLILLISMAVTRPPADVYCIWRLSGWGAWLSPVIVCTWLLILILPVTFVDISFTWLLSLNSLPAVVFLPALVLVIVGLATRSCVQPPSDFRRSSLPIWFVYSVAGVMALTVAAGSILLPPHLEPWRPPAAIQLIRQIGFLIGVESVVFMAIGLIWGVIRRRREHLPAGVQARATLGVCASALLATSVIALISLGINRHNDYLHQQAFAQAAADPIADRLGEAWRQDYFGEARAVLESLQSRHQ